MTTQESPAHRRARGEAQRLVAELRQGRLSRQEFTRRAFAIGFSGTAISLMLAACSVGPFGSAAPTATPATTPASSASASGAASTAPSAAASAAASGAATAPAAPGSAATGSGTPAPASSAATPATPASPTATATPAIAASPIATPQGALLGGPVPANAPLADKQALRYPSVEPNSADPGKITSLQEVQFANACWDGLIRLDQGGEPQPAHATKYDISADGLKWTFTLRSGLKWSDGGALTAKDYEWTWKRNLSPELASEYAQALYPIKGARDYATGANPDRNAVGVKATGDTTLEVTLAAPAPQFLALVSTWPFFPLQQATIEKNKEKWTEAGTIVTAGQFKVQSWDHEQQLILVRDENYYGTKPTLEQVTLRFYKNLATDALPAYEKGDLDIATVLRPEDLARVRQDAKLRVDLSVLPSSGTGFVVFDTGNANSPASKKEFRQAVYQAINRDRLCTTVLQSQFFPTGTLVPKGILGHLDQPPTAYNVKGDSARAKQLLQTAGYAGQEVVLTHSDQARAVALAQAIGQDLKDAGVNVRLDKLDSRAYAAWRQARVGQPFDLYVGSWFSDYEDPANWYDRFFASPDDEYWHTHYPQLPGSARFNELLASAGKEQDRKKREALYVEIEKILLDDLPLAPIYGFLDAVLVKPNVKGLVHTPTGLDLFGAIKILK